MLSFPHRLPTLSACAPYGTRAAHKDDNVWPSAGHNCVQTDSMLCLHCCAALRGACAVLRGHIPPSHTHTQFAQCSVYYRAQALSTAKAHWRWGSCGRGVAKHA